MQHDTIAIIGAGFSGAATAIHLLTLPHPRPLRVLLINRSGAMARGLAYGTSSREHLLNVPAGNMSALADDPGNFLRYAQWADPAIEPSSFVPRQLYGAYLDALTHAAAHRAPADRQLEHWVGDARSVRPLAGGGGLRLTLADGRSIDAAHVVLAFGHFMPADPPLRTPGFCDSSRCVRDPWAGGALDAVPADRPVLLLGSGLTAVDVALALSRQPRTAPILCLSRRGLLPAPHRPARGHWGPEAAATLAAGLGQSVRADLRALRGAVRAHEATGGDWRDVVGALRPHTVAWWQRLDLVQRRRFLARLQPYWDVARHRCAPPAHASFEALRATGQVQVLAGRVNAVHEETGTLRVHWQPRGQGGEQVLDAAVLINCTGPSADLRRARSALVQQLLDEGLISPDPLRLGVAVSGRGAPLAADGQPTPGLHYVGPLLRARDWEATAVPELRVHAQLLAGRLLAALSAPAADAV
jgi:uncharacterized NAD(P)/FAD-binding protein YdhS